MKLEPEKIGLQKAIKMITKWKSDEHKRVKVLFAIAVQIKQN